MNWLLVELLLPAVVVAAVLARFGMWLGTRMFRQDDAFISPTAARQHALDQTRRQR